MKTMPYMKMFRSVRLKLVLILCSFMFSIGFSVLGFAQSSQAWQDELQPLDLGHAMVAKGNDNLLAGRKLIEDGYQRIAAANDAVREGRSKYRALLGSQSASPENAIALAATDVQISKNLDEIGEGDSMLTRGEKLIAKGREQINNGRQTIDSGYKKTQKTKRSVELRLMLPEKSVLQE